MVKVLQHCPGRLNEENELKDVIDRDVQGVNGNSNEEIAKVGACLFVLRHADITQWGYSGAEMYIGESKEHEEKLKDRLKERKEASIVQLPMQKKRCLSICNHEETKAASGEEKGKNDHKFSGKCDKVERWSAERYNMAQKNLLDILKAEGAVFGKEICRRDLRAAARERVGDTGLLDHLLKHIDGKVAPGGTERFRRCYNANGMMEYWLESADIDEIRRKSGVSEPNWITPSECKSRDALQLETAPAEELKLLQAEMDKFKGDVLRIVTKDIERIKDSAREEMHKKLMMWNDVINQRLLEIRSSVSNVQDLMSWKDKVQQQIMELSNTVSTLQSMSKGSTPCTLRWDDFLGGTNLDITAPWWDTSGPLSVGEETMVPTKLSLPEAELKTEKTRPVNTLFNTELNGLKDEVANIKREMKGLLPKKQEEDQSNGTPDSVISTNSKLDVDNTLVMFKETFTEMTNWKAKVEKKVADLANTLAGIAPNAPQPK